ncbi:MAG TPA: diguanylate cyclase [Bryobacteraceae bacterium]|nr:diguanylate cyclase [Bryobacteraceae bacterium]
MISIRKSAEELDRLDNLRQAMADCYSVAIYSSAEYAVEVDGQQASRFRERLHAVGERWKAAADPGELRMVGQSFRGELRDYHRVAGESLEVLRKEVEAAAAAIASLAGGIASHGADHEKQLQRELDQLAIAAASDDVTHIRSAIQTAISQIHAAVVEMQLANRMVIAQLQDEIRLLHREIDSDRHRAANPAAWLRTRRQMEQKIDDALSSRKPFCLLLIAISDWRSVVERYSCASLEAAIQEMIGRLHAAIDPDLIVGRWGEEELVAMLYVDPATAIAISRQAASALSGTYLIEENGEPGTVELKVKAGVIDRAAVSEPSGFRNKLAALAAALSKA